MESLTASPYEFSAPDHRASQSPAHADSGLGAAELLQNQPRRHQSLGGCPAADANELCQHPALSRTAGNRSFKNHPGNPPGNVGALALSHPTNHSGLIPELFKPAADTARSGAQNRHHRSSLAKTYEQRLPGRGARTLPDPNNQQSRRAQNRSTGDCPRHYGPRSPAGAQLPALHPHQWPAVDRTAQPLCAGRSSGPSGQPGSGSASLSYGNQNTRTGLPSPALARLRQAQPAAPG